MDNPDNPLFNTRLLKAMTWLMAGLLVVLLGIIGWITWASITGAGATSHVEIMRILEDSNRQSHLTTCILLVHPDERTAQSVADCVAAYGR